MNNLKKLAKTLAPMICAVILALVVLYGPFKISKPSNDIVQEASTSLAPNVLRGTQIKEQALDDNYLLMMGSSELSRFDTFHPAILAQKYNRGYQPFLLGAAGTQSLTHYFSLQALGNSLDNKKVVVIVSPQWFVPRGVNPAMFDYYYSKQQAVYFIDHADINSPDDRYAAKRLLAMPSGSADNNVKLSLQNIAKGRPLTAWQKFSIGEFSNKNLQHQDQLFTSLFIKDRRTELRQHEKVLPAKYNYNHLDNMATTLGREHTTNNDFNIYNQFYTHQLSKNIVRLRGSQKKLAYVRSPEYADFQLLLHEFKQHNVTPLFIIPPVNSKWMEYTGLRQSMLNDFNRKITYQLQSQGFNNIVDFHDKGDQPYFMQDTIHLGWRGWLATDKQVSRFARQKVSAPVYHLNDYFYNSKWCNRNPQTVPVLK